MIIKNLNAGQNLEVADKTWEDLREEGGIIEEALKYDPRHRPLIMIEEVDEGVASPSDAVAGTSFDEKAGRLHGYQMDVVDIHPAEHPSGNEDGRGLL